MGCGIRHVDVGVVIVGEQDSRWNAMSATSIRSVEHRVSKTCLEQKKNRKDVTGMNWLNATKKTNKTSSFWKTPQRCTPTHLRVGYVHRFGIEHIGLATGITGMADNGCWCMTTTTEIEPNDQCDER